MNTNAIDVQPFVKVDNVLPNIESCDSTAKKVLLERVLIAVCVCVIAFLLYTVLNPYHFVLTGAYGLAGLWATHKMSKQTSLGLSPILISLNLVLWPISFIALPIAALTIGIASDFPIEENTRNALRLSGLTGAALTLLCMLA